MWTPTRIAFYLTSFLAGIGFLLSAAGLAEYDAEAMTIDLDPFSIHMVVGIVAPVLASILAAVAAFLGWGKK
jgi:hypothetical protein